MIIPCIDLQSGKAVQLVRGRRRALAVDDVFGLLARFRKYSQLHIIDIDAALGTGRNDHLVRMLCREAKRRYGFRVRVGGGIRTASRAVQLLRVGADQVILGSAVFQNGRIRTRFLSSFARRVGRKRVIIALDSRKGKIVVRGWQRRLRVRPEGVIPQLESYCAGFLCTFVDNEGTLRGTNLEWFRKLRGVTSLPIIAAGGIHSRREVLALERIGIDAAVGMALYLNRFR
jgi:phosphoribosylformimino-5-aminoimidazole carboxamide ribotide isomerase